MINYKIKFFFLVFIPLTVIFSAVHSDEQKPQNHLKKSTAVDTKTLISNSSNSVLKKKKVEENFLGELITPPLNQVPSPIILITRIEDPST